MKGTEDFRKGFHPGPEGLPERIGLQYEVESCLAEKEGRSVWRLRRRADGAAFLLKTAPAEAGDLTEEFRILTQAAPLLRGAAPLPADCFQENGTAWLVRSYLPGETLAQYRERTGTCSAGQCARWGRKLCALLEALHGAGVIHRDVKPENIILLPGGGVGLIDFGIARQYKEGQDRDTRRLGTRSTAAPEQYGYAQTDRRTDIYGLGMTLLWAATGRYDREALPEVPEPLRRALERATAFSPEDRWQDAAAFSAALAGRGRKKPGLALLAALLAALCLGLWTAGRPAAVEFSSRSLEAAVRAALERPEGAVTYADLEDVRRLAVVGDRTFSPEERFEYRVGCYLDNVPQEGRGDAEDLSLLARMPNLTELYLCRQEIADLRPLEGLPLTTLALCENRIADLSPLEEMTGLEALYLGGNPVTNAEALSGLARLRLLNLDGNWEAVTVLDSFGFLTSLALTDLSLGRTLPRDGDWSPLAAQPGLDTLFLAGPPAEALAAANALAGLRMLSVSVYPEADLTALSGLRNLEVLSLYTALDSLEGVEAMPGLHTLALGDSRVTDLTPLEGLNGLSWVHLTDVPVSDFSPLAALPALEHVQVNREQAAAVEEACPGRGFELAFN